MPQRKASIGLIDDHYIVRRGIRNLVESFNEYTVWFDVENFTTLKEKLKEYKNLDILLLDIKMPEKNGFEVALWMREHYPLIRMLALSSEEDGFSIARIIKNGANGFCGKSASPNELQLAIETVLRGDVYMSQKSLNMFNDVLQHSTGYFTTEKIAFNNKENELIKWACTSLSFPEIADKMNISAKTLDGYRSSIYIKLGIQTRQELAVYATLNHLQ